MSRLVSILIIIGSTICLNAQKVELNSRPISTPCSVKPNISSFVVITNKKELKESGCYFNYSFKDKSIIGINTSIGGCSLPDVSLQIFEYPLEMRYEIVATILQRGACRRNNPCYLILECQKLNPLYSINTSLVKKFR